MELVFYESPKKSSYGERNKECKRMHERIRTLRSLEPVNSGRTSYLAILEAAAGLFSQFAAEDITLRDILVISGVSNQSLYNYFPSGRDDIALVLYDRFQGAMAEDFSGHIRSIKWGGADDDAEIIAYFSACLAKSVFGLLKTSRTLQSNLYSYLRAHNLLGIASHSDELEAALMQAFNLPIGHRFVNEELPRVVRVSVHTIRGIADLGLMDPAFSLDKLESNARKLGRALLRTGLRDLDSPSGSHGLAADSAGPGAIQGASLSPAKKQDILERIMKRKRSGSA